MMSIFPPNIFKLTFLLALCFAMPLYARGDSEEISSPEDTHYPAIVKIDSEQAVEELENAGVTILRRRDELLLCFIPYPSSESNLPRKSRTIGKYNDRHEGVMKIERGRRVTPNMDQARDWFGAYTIHEGSSSVPPFTGKGVVAGICDIGIDPLHIGFLDPEGNPRIKRIVQYKEGTGERILMESKEEYEDWQTDSHYNWHATHVANIMAGGYGTYRGMAPEADIVITTSQLSDVGLLCGAEDILEYAKQQGKRAVINMSMGNYTGPHDGSSLFSQYLDRIAEEAIAVLSAGNAGSMAATLPIDFTSDLTSASLLLYSRDWVQFDPYGAVDIWSAEATPVRVRFGILDADNVRQIIMYPWHELKNGESFSVTSDPGSAFSSEGKETIYDETFASIFSGWFELQGGIDSENGRYEAVLQYDAHTDIVSSKGPWARYVPVIEVCGEPGTHADIYADWQFTVFRSLPGQPTPGSLLSFSDLATGNNVISVGMYVNRDHVPWVEGEDISINLNPGWVAAQSGYSTLLDGRVMPHTVAPGYGVISAMSRPFWDAHPGHTPINAITDKDGEQYLWATNNGTSMSAPYMAGTLACWLEAIPTLTSSQAQEIIERSNRHDFPDGDNPRHGRGYLDPVEGLKLALTSYSSSGVTFPEYAVDKNEDSRRLSLANGVLTLWNPGGHASQIEISDISGKLLLTLSSSATCEQFDLSLLSSGIYLARIPSSTVQFKFLLK